MAKIGNDGGYPLTGKYELKNSISLSNWTPIGTQASPFRGSFDGKGKTITLTDFNTTAVSSNTCLGIFGHVEGASTAAKAKLKDIAINSSVNHSSSMGSGQVIGLLVSIAKNTVITGINLSGSFGFDSAKTLYLGGVVGALTEGAVIKNCGSVMNMNITPGTGAATGIPVIGNAYCYIGGFVGFLYQGGGIENCHNTADVSAISTVAGSQVFVGGVAGGSQYGFITDYQGYIADSSSSGNITGKAKGFWTYAGGIAGTIVGGTDDGNDTNDTRIVRCRASGTVSVAGTSSGNPYIGGITGYNYYGALVSQSSFSGIVIAAKTGDYTGGIAGYNSQTSNFQSRIEDCWSSGTVTGFNNAGGIVGQNQINTYIRRCYSTAAVSTTNNAAAGTGTGGIAGMNASAQDNAITACFALNTSITSANSGTKTHSVVGSTTQQTLSSNYGSSGLTPSSGGGYAADKGTDKVDGADCAAQPSQGDYVAAGWNFAAVWKMGGDGYPRLQWEP
jgi:hypothetical protein